jgi:hypothetical protein
LTVDCLPKFAAMILHTVDTDLVCSAKAKQNTDAILQPSLSNSLPSRSLELEYVYAFKGKDSRANILCLREQEAITFVGPLGIVHCLASNSQVVLQAANERDSG